ncbi:hypothetical protein BDR03DRAFT_946465 [Suillus americanus]|nr:hypothetical protein BDR03DRAFT_946465 [Suillus americanus]
MIIDAHCIIQYLKYTTTRKLLSGDVRRRQVDSNPSLDHARSAFIPRISNFYKALMVQAQRFHLKPKDFDIAENTILNSQLFPEHFEQVKKSVSMHLTKNHESLTGARPWWMSLLHGSMTRSRRILFTGRRALALVRFLSARLAT